MKDVDAHWPTSDRAGYFAISGFLFLRFICVAMCNPAAFNVCEQPRDKRLQRGLTLCAKALQTLANLSEVVRLSIRQLHPHAASHAVSLPVSSIPLAHTSSLPPLPSSFIPPRKPALSLP